MVYGIIEGINIDRGVEDVCLFYIYILYFIYYILFLNVLCVFFINLNA
jgi:hypothetical protein